MAMSLTRTTKNILIIDDELIVRQSLRDQLEDLGYQVVDTDSGKVGIELIKTTPPDLLLTDLRMPEMDGLEVIRQSLKLEPNLPIIVISGAGKIGDAVEALKLGAYDYLTKPLAGLDILEHRVDKALKNASLVQENQAYHTRLEELVYEKTRELEEANQKLSNINNRLTKIVKTTPGLSGCINIDSFGSRILSEFAEHMVASGGSIYLIEKEGLKLLHSLDPGHSKGLIPFPLDQESALYQVIDTGEPLFIEDLKSEPSLNLNGWNDYQNGSFLLFPIPNEMGKSIGVVTLHTKAKPPFVEQDKEMGMILASYSCETLRAAKAFEAVQTSEKRYHELFQKSKDAIFLIENNSGKYLDANLAATLLTGYTVNELKDLSGQDTHTINVDSFSRDTFEIGAGQDFEIATYTRPDGTERVAQLTTFQLDEHTLIGIARDITNERAIEQQLRHAQKMDAVGQMAGGIAHDFNNILGIILGNIELLKGYVSDNDGVIKRVKAIEKSAQRAAGLTKQLLGFSRREPALVESVDINQLLGGMKDLVRRSVTPQIEVEFQFSDDLWLTSIDSGDFHDAVLNLSLNARDAMEGHGQLLLETDNTELDRAYCAQNPDVIPGKYVRFTISDTGKGIPNSLRNQIFEPFFTTKPKGQGTGLGLAMVFGFIKRSRGHVKIESKVGAGTTFKILLPKSDVSDSSSLK